MLMLKPGVRITGIRPEMVLAVCTAERVYEEMGVDCVVTACVDGKHSTGSFHYAGAAVDLRTRDVPAAKQQTLAVRLRECLGADFDVLLEKDHIHLEFQPKQPLG